QWTRSSTSAPAPQCIGRPYRLDLIANLPSAIRRPHARWPARTRSTETVIRDKGAFGGSSDNICDHELALQDCSISYAYALTLRASPISCASRRYLAFDGRWVLGFISSMKNTPSKPRGQMVVMTRGDC